MMATNERTIAAAPRGFIVAVVNIIHGIIHLNMHGMSVLYPVLREQFVFGYMGIAFLSVVSQMVTGPMQITFGVLTRLARRLHILGIGATLAFLGTIVMAVSQSYGHLVAGRVIRGIGSSPNHPVGGAIMADWSTDSRGLTSLPGVAIGGIDTRLPASPREHPVFLLEGNPCRG
jgi:MFS family permease